MNTPTVVRTVAAAAALALATLAGVALLEIATGTSAPLLPLVAVIASTWYAGLPGGFAATAIATGVMPLVVPPLWTFEIAETPDIVRVALLALLGVGATLMIGRMRRTAETLGATLASIGDGVLVTDSAGRIRSLNRVAEQLTGWTGAEAIGRHVQDVFVIVNQATRQAADNPVRRVLEEGAIVGLANHTVLIARDGTERIIDDSGAPIRYRSGRIAGAVLVFRDDTERRRAEDARKESEERFRSLADHAPVLMWVNDLNGCEFVNREYLRFTGLSFEEAVGTGWTTALHPEDAPGYLAAYRDAFERRARFEALLRFRRADGEYRWLKSVGVPRVGPGGDLRGYVGVSVDITDLKEAEQVLQQASRTKDQFLATVSHELRTPLNAILGWTMMLRDAVDFSSMGRGLATIDRNARALARIIEDLLDFSRTTRGELRVVRVPLDLRVVVQSVVQAVDVVALQKQVTLAVERLETGVVLGDALRLQQVITNLLSNAIKFTPAGGRIIVSVTREDSQVVLSVRDTGIGIRRDHLQAIFDPFRQIDPHGSLGLGLGLAIVYQVVEAHDGTVEAHSDGPGSGATFVVRLPAVVEAAA